MTAISFFGALDILGTFVFGLSGAMLAIRQRCDLFGVLVLAAATGVAGGILRDVLLGATPPAVLRSLWPIGLTCAAGLVAFFFGALIDRMTRPVMVLDALGLGVFAIAGCQKALSLGVAAPGAVLLGVITAVGGGVVRDIMANEVPRVLREEVYALAALAGAAVYLGGLRAGLEETVAATVGLVLAVAIRLASVRWGWNLPRAPWF
jgi:uncharacterized membrane protein YeiH